MPELTHAIARVRRRLRWSAALRAAVRTALWSVVLGSVSLACGHLLGSQRVGPVWGDVPRALPYALSLALAPPMLSALWAATRARGALDAAQRLDEVADNASRFANALAFESRPTTDRSPFEAAAIEDARRHLVCLDAVGAAPLRAPAQLGMLLLAIVGLVAASTLRSPAAPAPALAAAPAPPLALLDEDTLDAVEQDLHAILVPDDDPAILRETRDELEGLLEQLRQRRLDEADALRRVDALSQHFLDQRPDSTAVNPQQLRRLGHELEGATSLEATAEALRRGSTEHAAGELERLAARLSADDASRAELARLRRALERAARQAAQHPDDDARAARERAERLLRRERERADSPSQRRLLRRHRRRLEELRREEARAQAQRRQLQHLERELRSAAHGAQRRSASDTSAGLSRAAEQLHRMGRSQAQDQRSAALARQIEQLRELLRRSRPQGTQGEGSGAQGAGARRRRFTLRAGGQPIGVGRRPGTGGQPRPGSGGMGAGGMGAGGMGAGNGDDPRGAQGLMLGGGDGEADAVLEIPGGSQGRSQGADQGNEPGPGAGVAHDESRLDDPSSIAHDLSDSRVRGQASAGPSRSEVIEGAAARGFVDQGYRGVYEDYRGHSEEVLERDRIPPGYRFYVRRYFQLIRPRQESE